MIDGDGRTDGDVVGKEDQPTHPYIHIHGNSREKKKYDGMV